MEPKNKTSLLEDMMPEDWDICNNLDPKGIDIEYGFYKYYCKSEMFGPMLKEKFGKDYASIDFYNDNIPNIMSYINGLISSSEKSWKTVSARFCQDYRSLVETTNDMIQTSIDRKISQNEMHQDGSGFTEYAPTISFIKRFYGDDCTKKKIVEVGAGTYGMIALSYLKTLGFDTYSMDPYAPNEEFLKKVGVENIADRWENIAGHFDEGSVDAIYINFMHPSPHYGGPFMTSDWNKDIKAFTDHITGEMDKILRPGGMFITRLLGADMVSEFVFPDFGKFNGHYSNTKLTIENHGDYWSNTWNFNLPDYNPPWNVTHLKEYPINPADKDIYFGRMLKIFQKKE